MKKRGAKSGKRQQFLRLHLSLQELIKLAQEEAAEFDSLHPERPGEQRFAWSTYTHHRCEKCRTIQRIRTE